MPTMTCPKHGSLDQESTYTRWGIKDGEVVTVPACRKCGRMIAEEHFTDDREIEEKQLLEAWTFARKTLENVYNRCIPQTEDQEKRSGKLRDYIDLLDKHFNPS